MTKELSALRDGELDAHEAPALWARVKTEAGTREAWGEYQLIGDVLRGERHLAADITAKVMAQLSEEPTVLAPRPRPATAWYRSAMAIAASVAGIAVVGWFALTQYPMVPEAAQLARNEPPAPPAVAATAVPPKGIEEYVLAHQANAQGLHMQGGTQHIRTVSAIGGQ